MAAWLPWMGVPRTAGVCVHARVLLGSPCERKMRIAADYSMYIWRLPMSIRSSMSRKTRTPGRQSCNCLRWLVFREVRHIYVGVWVAI